MHPFVEAEEYNELIRSGLQTIREEHQGKWCLPRHLSANLPVRRNKKRKAEGAVPTQGMDQAVEPAFNITYADRGLVGPGPFVTLSANEASFESASFINRVIHNPLSIPKTLHNRTDGMSYSIPSQSTFLISHINPTTCASWSSSVLKFYSTPTMSAGPGQFDLIVIDPPWQNRSVNRSKKYKTLRESNPLSALGKTLSPHMAPNAFVAMWITNNVAVRNRALAIFEDWDVAMFEEWIWLKSTVEGESVSPVDGIWRKPYEVLLLGRKRDSLLPDVHEPSSSGGGAMPRRLVVGVPDLHSRKPCLKELLEPLVPDPRDYRGLEIFARNLTAGWWSWGDEVLKFNWDGHWCESREVADSA
jgi:N6-adenosine-specific RNA methylase IME4